MKKKICIVLLSILISLIIVLLKNGFSQLLPGQNHGMSELIRMKEVDNLYVGSSMIKLGIDPRQIGDNDYVLAYNGNEPANINRELEYLLKNNVKINNLYVDMYVWTIAQNPWIDDLTILWDSDLETTINIYKDLDNHSLRYAYEFFVSANNDYLFTYPISVKLLNSYHYKGGNNYVSFGKTKEQLDNLPLPPYVYENIFFGEKQIEAIKNINKMCIDNNINLIFIETPKYEKEANWDIYIRLMDRYEKLLKDNNINYILANELNIDNKNPEYYLDLVHLSSSGRVAYTEALLKYLQIN